MHLNRKKSIKLKAEVLEHYGKADAKDLSLEDGNKMAVRIAIGSDGAIRRTNKGAPVICAPWLLSTIFS